METSALKVSFYCFCCSLTKGSYQFYCGRTGPSRVQKDLGYRSP